MRIEVDKDSGFCPGVVSAIKKAEDHLKDADRLYCLGDIVHNSQEVQRLEALGLDTIGPEQLIDLHDTKVLLRAHGEPPETYQLAERNNIQVIDATCPVVLQLQRKIRSMYEAEGDRVQIVIFGKNGHAEVNGLVGQTAGTAIVVERVEDIDKIDVNRPVRLYSQTTMPVDEFRRLAETLAERMTCRDDFQSFDTICRQVANRIPHMRQFASEHDVILLVSGKKSSNGKALFEECRSVNPRTYFISHSDEVTDEMLTGADSIGICGATSTPRWQMEEVHAKLIEKTNTKKHRDMEVKTIGILTSGGDAPGMNAAIRAVTRAAIYAGMRVFGIYRGYQGLIEDQIEEFKTQNVSNIISRGGTILKTARSKDFKTPEGRKLAYENMQKHGIDALVVIGGDGSITGASILAKEYDIPIVGLPGTIDNDLAGTDMTIGYDTAMNTIMECVDKIRDTATSHARLFFIEVMGRDAGFLALNGAIATGCEDVIIPEETTQYDQLKALIENGFRKSKSSSMVLVTESKDPNGGALGLAERMKKEFPEYDVRCSILGHLQRGGSPTAADRILASRTGYAAVEALREGQRNVMIGIHNDHIVNVPFHKAIKKDKPIDPELLTVLRVLSI